MNKQQETMKRQRLSKGEHFIIGASAPDSRSQTLAPIVKHRVCSQLADSVSCGATGIKKRRKQFEREAKVITVIPETHDAVRSCRTSAESSWSYGNVGMEQLRFAALEEA